MMYDVIIVGAGPGGIFSAYELVQKKPGLKIAVFEAGNPLSKRHCPIDGEKVKTCIGCKTCAIMSGCGGAGAFSDGKYNITNDFGGTLYEHIGKKTALDLMKYVDEINVSHGGENTRMFSTAGTKFKKLCIQNKLKLLDASVRHLGTDINYVVLENLYNELKEQVDFFFLTPVTSVEYNDSIYTLHYGKDDTATCKQCIISVGRSGSKWMETVCQDLLEVLLIWLVRCTTLSLQVEETPRSDSRECVEIKRYLDSNYREDISLDILAEIAHINKYYLAHTFQKEYGISPITYLNRRRIEESKYMLGNTGYSLAQISELMGFSSPSYFSQCFRKAEGLTPNEYRRQVRQGQRPAPSKRHEV